MHDHASGHIDLARLRDVLDGPWAKVRNAHREHLDERFLPVYGETGDQARERISRLLTELPVELGIASAFPTEYGGSADVGGSIIASEMLAQVDLSLMVKAGVQWGLFGGAVQALGTQRHHDAYLRDIIYAHAARLLRDDRDRPRLRRPAAAHHRDVRPADATSFVMHTPDEAARKDYIGNAARDGRMAVVFAQLITGRAAARRARVAGADPRRRQGNPLPGVTIGDCRAQGRPARRRQRAAQLRPRAGAARHAARPVRRGRRRTARYTSPIENDTRRFFTMLGTLVRGRVSVAGARRRATKSALTIAVRYGEHRRQFDTPGADREVVMLDYLAHQRKLLPALATTYALHFAQTELVAALHEVQAPATGRSTSTGSGSWSPGPPASRPSHDLARDPHHPDVPRGVRRRRLPGGEPAARRSRPTPTSSPRSRATTRCCCSWSPRGCSPATATSSATWTRWARCVRRRAGRARWCIERTAARGRSIERLIDAVPGRDERDAADRPRLAARRVRGPRAAPPRRRWPGGLRGGAATRKDRPFDIFNDVQDHVLGRRRRAHRPGHPGGVRRRHRGHRRPGGPGAALPRLRPVRAQRHRGQQGLVPGARPAHAGPLEGDHRRGERTAQRAAPAHANARGRVRHPGHVAALRHPARGTPQAGNHVRP